MLAPFGLSENMGNGPAPSPVLNRYDSPETLFYVDPPYLKSTRKSAGARYVHEFRTDEEHQVLIERLRDLAGFMVLSGRQSELYEEGLEAHGWARFDRPSRDELSETVESVWLNPHCAGELRQGSLFEDGRES